MVVLYLTNKDIQDRGLIPGIIEERGDTVIIYTSRIDIDYIKNNNINFIVCDRPRFLIKKDVIPVSRSNRPELMKRLNLL